jgi:tetratricopeptide (TPR) repeat protein
MACGQIVNYAWWQGIDAAEIEPIFKEAMTLADKLNDTRAAALITMAFGRVLVVAGSSDDYVGKVEEAQKLNEGSGNQSVAAMLAAVHAHALLTAGHLPLALEANTKALGVIDQLNATDRQTLGFDPGPWLKTHRARILMYLGQFSEADAILDDLLAGPPLEAVNRINAHGTKIEGYRKDRPADAAHEAEQIRGILRENATPYLKVLGNRYCAIATLADGAAADAVNLLNETIGYARTQRVGLEVEPYLLTALAEALMATASPEARAVAIEARDLAQRRAMRTAELEAIAVLASIDGRA